MPLRLTTMFPRFSRGEGSRDGREEGSKKGFLIKIVHHPGLQEQGNEYFVPYEYIRGFNNTAFCKDLLCI